jgi:hypothetical protein
MEINYQLLSIKNVQALTLRALSDTVNAILSVIISPLVILNRTNHTVSRRYAHPVNEHNSNILDYK